MVLTEVSHGSATRREGFVIFYASRDENQTMWCSDCRIVEQDIKEVFETVNGAVVYVGGREE